MTQTRLQVPRIQTHLWDQQSLLHDVDSAIKCPSPTVEHSVPITRITEAESEYGALYCGFRRMSHPRVPCSPRPADRSTDAKALVHKSRPRSILKRRNDPFRATRPKRTASFDEAQYHRPEEHYRSQDEFDRNSALYTPGIYADLSGNGYEDTSRCSDTGLLDTHVESYQPTSHDDLEKALKNQMEQLQSHTSLPLPRGWLSEQQATDAQQTVAKTASFKRSKSNRSKKSQRERSLPCGAYSKESTQPQSQAISIYVEAAR